MSSINDRDAQVNPSANGKPRSTFLNIPSAIAARTDITPGAKLLYGAINSLYLTFGKCTASNETLARNIGMSVIQVRRLLAELEKAELISREMKGKQRSCINLVQGAGSACIKDVQSLVSDRASDIYQNDAQIRVLEERKKKDAPAVPARPERAGPSGSKITMQNYNPPLPPDPDSVPVPAHEFSAAFRAAIAAARAEAQAKEQHDGSS